MYKKGGKSPKKKNSFMEKSKEITFGDKPSIKKSGGLYSAAEKSENIATLKKMDPSAKKKTGGPDDPPTTPAPKSTDTSSDFYALANKAASASPRGANKALRNARKYEVAKATGTRAGSKIGESLAGAGAALSGAAQVVTSAKSMPKPAQEKTGGKRKTGGMSKFREMAAKGKKGMGGMSDSTSSNDAGMSMMENEETEEVMDEAARAARRRARARRKAVRRRGRLTDKLRRNIGTCNRGEICFD